MNWINAALSDEHGGGLIMGPAGLVFAWMCFRSPRLMGRLWGFGYTLSPHVVRILGWLCIAAAVYAFVDLAGFALLGWRKTPSG